jgi:antitoxin component YwqK of YwqJK toxin-antitoxin module
MKHILTIITCCCFAASFAQKSEIKLDYFFRPTKGTAHYHGTSEQKGDKWYMEIYYSASGNLAATVWYKDKELVIAHGENMIYHPNKQLKSKINYLNGRENGTALRYHDNGRLSDSATYRNGHLIGTGMAWNSSGRLTDSSVYDGAGNGTEVKLHANGKVSYTGRVVNDSLKVGKWTHYHLNGKPLAIEEYGNDGKRTGCNCFDDTGQPIDASLCIEKEAQYKGGEAAWLRFLQKNLNPNVPVKKRAPVGHYTVAVRFVVDKDGHLTELEPITKMGYGMEEELMRMLRQSPRWEPAIQFGRNVKAYRIQPITFVVEKE